MPIPAPFIPLAARIFHADCLLAAYLLSLSDDDFETLLDRLTGTTTMTPLRPAPPGSRDDDTALPLLWPKAHPGTRTTTATQWRAAAGRPPERNPRSSDARRGLIDPSPWWPGHD